jgi:hypothetical protein
VLPNITEEALCEIRQIVDWVSFWAIFPQKRLVALATKKRLLFSISRHKNNIKRPFKKIFACL